MIPHISPKRDRRLNITLLAMVPAVSDFLKLLAGNLQDVFTAWLKPCKLPQTW